MLCNLVSNELKQHQRRIYTCTHSYVYIFKCVCVCEKTFFIYVRKDVSVNHVLSNYLDLDSTNFPSACGTIYAHMLPTHLRP